jgi:hypothetical protein
MSEERYVIDPRGKRIAVVEMTSRTSPPREREAQKRQKKEIFVQISPTWQKRMNGLSGKTQTVARYILEQHFKNYGRPVKLTNGPLSAIGIGREAKSQALDDLEACGLIEVERHSHRAPVVQPLHTMRG